MMYRLHCPRETAKYAQHVAQRCRQVVLPQRLFFFSGPLGSGKTTFIQAFLQHLGVTDPVKSPSFGLLHVHQSDLYCILHADCYRFNHPEEWYSLGADWYFTQPNPLICCIEWPEQVSLGQPDAHFLFDYGITEEERTLEIHATDQALIWPNGDSTLIKES